MLYKQRQAHPWPKSFAIPISRLRQEAETELGRYQHREPNATVSDGAGLFRWADETTPKTIIFSNNNNHLKKKKKKKHFRNFSDKDKRFVALGFKRCAGGWAAGG